MKLSSRGCVIVLIGIFSFPVTSWQAELGISGSYEGETELMTSNRLYQHQHWLNLIFDSRMGQSAEAHINLELNTYETEQITPLIQEAYVDWYTTHIDWRFGRQIISWGSAYQLKPTDYFNPFDLTPVTPGEKRLGLLAASGTFFGPWRTELSGVASPFFQTHKLPGDTSNQLVQSTLIQTVASMNAQVPVFTIIPDPEQPVVSPNVEASLENTQWGLKFTKRGLLGMDLSLSGYHGFDKMSAFDEVRTTASINPFSFGNPDTTASVYFIYPEVTRAGLDLIGGIRGIGYWLETVYSTYTDDQFSSTLNSVVGLDYRFSNDLYLMSQAVFTGARVPGEDKIRALMVHTRIPVLQFHELEVTGLYDAESGSYFLQPQGNVSLGNAVTLELGGTLLETRDTQMSMLTDQVLGNRLYTRLVVNF